MDTKNKIRKVRKQDEREKEEVVEEIEAPTKLQLGARGIPVGMFRGEMEEKLLEEINKLPMFDCDKGSEMKKEFGFERCYDYNGVKHHHQYEGFLLLNNLFYSSFHPSNSLFSLSQGFFHSLETSQKVSSMEPRFGENTDTRAAPPILRSFFIALREKNSKWLKGISEELHEQAASFQNDNKKKEKGDPKPSKYISAFARLLDPSPPLPSPPRPFSDLAIQIHYGTSIASNTINFHFDQPNSVLHMALSLHGSRMVHSMRDDTVTFIRQKSGDIYVTSPHYFIHGVEYPSCKWEERVVAIQSRLLFLSHEEMAEVKEMRKGEGEEKVVGEVVGKRLLEGMKIPSYDEVMQVFKRLEDRGGGEEAEKDL